MSEIHYDAHPSMLRIRPFSTPLMFVLMLAGILFAVTGAALIPVPLPEPLDARIVKIAGLVVGGLALLQLCIWWLATRSDHLVIRDDELVWTHGLLSKNYTEIKLSSVRTVRLHQSLSATHPECRRHQDLHLRGRSGVDRPRPAEPESTARADKTSLNGTASAVHVAT